MLTAKVLGSPGTSSDESSSQSKHGAGYPSPSASVPHTTIPVPQPLGTRPQSGTPGVEPQQSPINGSHPLLLALQSISLPSHGSSNRAVPGGFG